MDYTRQEVTLKQWFDEYFDVYKFTKFAKTHFLQL